MRREALSVYLNDHLAGATAGRLVARQSRRASPDYPSAVLRAGSTGSE